MAGTNTLPAAAEPRYILGPLRTLVALGVLTPVPALIVALPLFGLVTLGMHAGYAISVPELYPTRPRGREPAE